jgi:hypothetical protein
MGQFKPMVKMMTTEPSVVLKLKKGGSVSKKYGHKMMDGGVMAGLAEGSTPSRMQMGEGTLPGRAPARPSLAMRRKMAMKRPMARPMMKEGGESKAEHAAEMKKMKGTEAKLKKHASMPASKAHKGLNTGGVVMGNGGGFKDGGIIKVAASEKGAKGYVKTKMDTAQGEHHTPKKTGEVSMGKPGGYKRGGSAYAKGGGVEGNVSTSKPGVSNTTTGEVKKGNAGGYKRGGKAKRMADGGISGLAGMIGPGVEGSAPSYLSPPPPNLGSQGGGGAFAGLGKIRGGAQDVESGLTSAQQAIGSSSQSGSGGMKKGGASKKRYATGGLVDSGKPVAYPKHQVSKPVANTIQSGTFKKGGKVYSQGGTAKPDVSKPVADPEATAAKAKRDLEDALNPVSMVKELGGKLMDKIRGKGSVTETKESVTVTPPQARRKAGGAC